MPIVSNSGPLLSFARAAQLDLLRAATAELFIPEAVYQEVVLAQADRPGAKQVGQAQWIKRREVGNRTLLNGLPTKLHLGEREALALAQELGATLLVDEREARREAQRLGIPHLGSLRILKELKDRRIIPAVKPVLDQLIQCGTYLAPELYSDFLRRMGE